MKSHKLAVAMQATMDFAARRMGGDYVLIGYETVADQFRVWTAEGDQLNITKLEAATHSLLRRMVEVETSRKDSCAKCPACASRLARVTAALAALDNGSAQGSLH